MKKAIIKTESEIFNEIKSGKYRNSYLIYNRKSTDDTDNQKNSILYQRIENIKFAKNKTLPIAPLTIKSFCKNGIISEKHSGFKEDDELLISDDGLVQYKIERPKFQRILYFLNLGYFKGVICLCWDRISRNKRDDLIIRKLMQKGINFHFIYAQYEKTSSGELHMDVDGMFAQHHSRVTSEKVILATKNARENACLV